MAERVQQMSSSRAMQDFFNEAKGARAARVLVDGLSDMLLDYVVPEGMEVLRGWRVEIPLRNRKTTGTVVRIVEQSEQLRHRMKPILRALEEVPVVSSVLMDLAEWASSYYAVPVEQMVRCIVPEPVRSERHEEKTRKVVCLVKRPSDDELNKISRRAPRQASVLRYLMAGDEGKEPLSDIGGTSALAACRALEKRQLVSIVEEAVHRDPTAKEQFAPTSPLPLNPEQEHALQVILEARKARDTRPILLQGVTGSGKTEVYLQAAAHVMEQGEGVLILVPEISLTPQTVARFKSRFAQHPGAVAILHSALSDGERYDEWHAIHRGQARIAIGPRSALFAPVRNLGLIIVDEEHDSSYKQESAPRYHGRDLAVLRARMEGASIIPAQCEHR